MYYIRIEILREREKKSYLDANILSLYLYVAYIYIFAEKVR